MPAIAQLGMQTASQAIGAGMGLVLGRHEDRRQISQQNRLTGIQMAAERQMTDYNMAKQLEMWEKTNYKAQIEQMKKAGLSPGLIYGMSGAGGGTTDINTGNVTGGQAAGSSGQALAGAGMGIQMGMAAAQQELMKAQAENLNADTENKRGIERTESGARTQNLLQNVKTGQATETLTKLQSENQELANKLQNATLEDQKELLKQQIEKIDREIDILITQGQLDRQQKEDKVNILKSQLAQTTVQTALYNQLTDESKSNIDVNNAQIQKMAAEIIDMIMGRQIDWAKLNLEQRKTALMERVGKFHSAPSQRWFDNILKAINTVLPILGKGGGATHTPIQGFQWY